MQIVFQRMLSGLGYNIRSIPYHHVKEIQETYGLLLEDGSLAEGVCDEVRQYVDFQLPDEMPEPQSVIILAVGNQPHMRLTFQWKGRQVPITLPNAYIPGKIKREEVLEDINRAVAKYGFRCIPAALPVKTLAARSGLAHYGRNNINHVEGMGSFHRLMAFYTDLPCTVDPWQEAYMLDRCKTCHACRSACPTGAIDGNNFLFRAERCITSYNEKDLGIHFPDWFEPTWHTCLAGCLQCQKICPENHPVLRFSEGEGFNEEETDLFLKGVKAEELPAETREKLERNGMLSVLEVLPRNLAVLLN